LKANFENRRSLDRVRRVETILVALSSYGSTGFGTCTQPHRGGHDGGDDALGVAVQVDPL
jgi:hypothetical protein